VKTSSGHSKRPLDGSGSTVATQPKLDGLGPFDALMGFETNA
jgi:hypothetical protein